jgi:D-alanyl-D-alanine carboxypeptidase (penicillin-binding protein 5/6)
MIFSRWLTVLASALALGVLLVPAAEKSGPKPYVGAIVTEAETGQVLFEDNADVLNPPASMTKLMTFAVLHDKLASGALALTTPVTVSRDEAKFAMKADSTSVWLKEKETFPVEELLYAMMVQSANDAALVLARAAAGSAEAFVELMNAKARALGMTRTTFRTPHGFTRGRINPATSDFTTPRDFGLLCRYLLLETDVTKYTAVKTRPFGAGQRAQLVEMRNHNHLLGKVAGLDGLKTGFTNGAGFCLSATAERHGRRVIVVVMGGSDTKSRDFRVAELIERGFAALPAAPPAVRTGATAPAPAAKPGAMVTVRTQPGAAPAEPASTPADPMFTFRVPPPEKKP